MTVVHGSHRWFWHELNQYLDQKVSLRLISGVNEQVVYQKPEVQKNTWTSHFCNSPDQWEDDQGRYWQHESTMSNTLPQHKTIESQSISAIARKRTQSVRHKSVMGYTHTHACTQWASTMKKQGLRKNETNKISHLYGLMFKELRCLNVHCEKKAFTTIPLHRASWSLSGGKKRKKQPAHPLQCPQGGSYSL